ncbi:hypothetical protein V6N13_072301 [Hibiscus sabdariffa]
MSGRWDEQNLLVCLQSLTSEVVEDVDDLQAVESLIVHGAIGSGFASRGSLDVHSIPVAARMRCSCAMLTFLKNRFGNLYRIGIQPWSPGTELLRSWGYGKDEVDDVGETLSKMISIVNPRYEISYYSD